MTLGLHAALRTSSSDENLSLEAIGGARTFSKSISERLSGAYRRELGAGDNQDQGRAANSATLAIPGRMGNMREDVAVVPANAPLLHRRPEARPAVSLQPIQEWEGYVTDIGDENFVARLRDITRRSGVEETEAEFLLEDLTIEDRSLLREGAIFRWVIGYERSQGGSKRRVSQLYFRRMPVWSRSEIANAGVEARELHDSINWE